MHDDWSQALVITDLRFAGASSEFMLEPNENNSDFEECYCHSSSVKNVGKRMNSERAGRKLSHR